MMTYLLLGSVVLFVLMVLVWRWPQRVSWRSAALTFVVLFVLTAVFDSCIVLANIVEYDTSMTLGIVIGAAPIEDFMYSVAAACLVPYVWTLLEGKQ